MAKESVPEVYIRIMIIIATTRSGNLITAVNAAMKGHNKLKICKIFDVFFYLFYLGAWKVLTIIGNFA